MLEATARRQRQNAERSEEARTPGKLLKNSRNTKIAKRARILNLKKALVQIRSPERTLVKEATSGNFAAGRTKAIVKKGAEMDAIFSQQRSDKRCRETTTKREGLSRAA